MPSLDVPPCILSVTYSTKPASLGATKIDHLLLFTHAPYVRHDERRRLCKVRWTTWRKRSRCLSGLRITRVKTEYESAGGETRAAGRWRYQVEVSIVVRASWVPSCEDGFPAPPRHLHPNYSLPNIERRGISESRTSWRRKKDRNTFSESGLLVSLYVPRKQTRGKPWGESQNRRGDWVIRTFVGVLASLYSSPSEDGLRHEDRAPVAARPVNVDEFLNGALIGRKGFRMVERGKVTSTLGL